MTTPDDRRRQAEEVRQLAGEALTAHSVPDDDGTTEMAELDARLDRLGRIEHDDTLGFVAFGDDDRWIENRMSK